MEIEEEPDVARGGYFNMDEIQNIFDMSLSSLDGLAPAHSASEVIEHVVYWMKEEFGNAVADLIAE